METRREPAVAGQFYPAVRSELEKMLSKLIPVDKSKKKAGAVNALCVMCPHAGYIYSGGVAGEVYSRIKPKKLFIILGPNHTGMGKPFSVFTDGKWATPMGEVGIDAEFCRYLTENSALFKPDNAAHAYEHSLEVQLPFLQYLMQDFKIVPIVISSLDIIKLKEAGRDLSNAIKALKKDATIVASSDMTHYESHESAKRKDMEALSAILSLDEDALARKVDELDISMCGIAPVIVSISAAKLMGARKAELVEYKTSGDSSGDYSSVVGYGGVVIT